MSNEAGLSLAHASGMELENMGTGQFKLSTDLSVNYIAAFHKPLARVAQPAGTSVHMD